MTKSGKRFTQEQRKANAMKSIEDLREKNARAKADAERKARLAAIGVTLVNV